MNEVNERQYSQGFCDTTTSRHILNVLSNSAADPSMGIGLIVGAAGVGKTTCIRHFSAVNSNTIAFTANATCRTFSLVMSNLCQLLTGHDGPRGPREKWEVITNFINWRLGEGAILIIDEAQILDDEIIDGIRGIYDETGAGLALVGNASFKTRFNHVEASAFAQVTSRVGMRLEIPGICEKDVDVICRFRRINGAAERKFILKYGLGPGGLRTVTKLIDFASRSAGEGQIPTLKHLKLASENIGFPH